MADKKKYLGAGEDRAWALYGHWGIHGPLACTTGTRGVQNVGIPPTALKRVACPAGERVGSMGDGSPCAQAPPLCPWVQAAAPL